MNNNNQFRKSITEVVNQSYNRAILALRKVEIELEKNPRDRKSTRLNSSHP